MNKYKMIIARILKCFPDYYLNYLIFIIKVGYLPNIKTPKSLNEKILHIKLFNRDQLRVLVADRIKVREYVTKKNREVKLPNMLWHGQCFSKEVWNDLPDKFILKGNHGSGMISFVDKKRTQYGEINKKIEKWLNTDYASISREWFYANLKKYVIAEELLNFNNDVPPDYKFFCFNGKVAFLQVDLDRFVGHKRNIYNREFKRLNVTLLYPGGSDIQKPSNFDNAVKIAEDLSSDFDFVRVDLFLLNDGVYFGEITNTPGGGFEKFTPVKFDFKIGKELFLKENELLKT